MPMCNRCGKEIGFKKTESGKWRPMNPDGTDHHCPETEEKAYKPSNTIENYMKSTVDILKGCFNDAKFVLEQDEEWQAIDPPTKHQILHRYVNTLFIARERRTR